MAKKEEKEEKEELKAEEVLEDKVQKKAEIAQTRGGDPQKIQNIIGEVTPPKDPDNKNQVEAYLAEISQNIKELLARSAPLEIKKEEPIEKPVDHFGFTIENKFLE